MSEFERITIIPLRERLGAHARQLEQTSEVVQMESYLDLLGFVTKTVGPVIVASRAINDTELMNLFSDEIEQFAKRFYPIPTTKNAEVIRHTIATLRAITLLGQALVKLPQEVVIDLSKATKTPPPVRPISSS